MKDQIFNISFKKLSIEWLPFFMRVLWTIKFVSILITPLELLYLEFIKIRKQYLIRLNTTSQKFSMQKRLNDNFDPVERRIEIVKAVLFDSLYLYTKSEDDQWRSKTKWLYGDDNPIYIHTKSELYSEFDFIVKVPSGINILQLNAEIEYYMLQSKNYKIEFI
ncbi:hypothetical protein [Chryseobacterium sp.]|uniref:hypothetical protein n=1 Tax=Chryseobacterium sp. TaxID=1871047 RepID=UPI0028978175|nr:hypothetical protein [Chryseobacterium sp.]